MANDMGHSGMKAPEERRTVRCAAETACGWLLSVPDRQDISLVRCPNCSNQLHQTIVDATIPVLPEPELCADTRVTKEAAAEILSQAVERQSLPPVDARARRLASRLHLWFECDWLVDVSVRAEWSAIGGYRAPVVAQSDRLDAKTWTTTTEVAQGEDWYPLAGTLERHYANLSVGASTSDGRSGDPTPETSVECDEASRSVWRIPELAKDQAVEEATRITRPLAAEECRMAATADSLHRFDWHASHDAADITLLLRPMWSTYYADDSGRLHTLQIDATSGEVRGQVGRSGRKLMSMLLLWCALGTLLLGPFVAARNSAGPWPVLAVGAAVLLALIGLAVWPRGRRANHAPHPEPNAT